MLTAVRGTCVRTQVVLSAQRCRVTDSAVPPAAVVTRAPPSVRPQWSSMRVTMSQLTGAFPAPDLGSAVPLWSPGRS